jgi:hypothetical protein
MNFKEESMMRKIIFLIPFIFFQSLLYAGQWKNPRDIIGDPMIVRLQQGRKELTSEEKEEIKRYGYTGLEIMSYVMCNKDPGKDNEGFYKSISVDSSGNIQIREVIRRRKYYYKDYRARFTYDGIKPGDVVYKRAGMQLYPPRDRGTTFIRIAYLKSKDNYKPDTLFVRSISLKRIRQYPTPNNQDKFYKEDMTHDDWYAREAWQENHRIIGEDNIRGKDCFVIESKNWYYPNYYLSKRVTWVEKKNFLDLHEEQFDRKGRLFKIMDKEWVRVPPWNYWVRKNWDIIDLSTKSRTIEYTYDWIFDQGFTEKKFSKAMLKNEKVWREPKNPPPSIRKLSDLPNPPQVRSEFWKRMDVAPNIFGRGK